MDVLVRFTDVPEYILEYLIEKGYYKTKAEAIRSAVFNLAREYHIFDKEEFLLKQKLSELEEKRKKGKLKTETLKQVKKKYGVK
ncbi:hypothetical protein J7J90_00045 [Candidatus Micrarchaeota archaeon]|nr:hypothetical protein [Candidatus Micrarchaeota archaeon]